jgi:CTP:molybdopterin cytidylyltransferase MocA
VPRAAVRILHLEPAEDTGELTRLFAEARAVSADDLAGRFLAAGADDVRVVAGPPDGRTFGERLRDLVRPLGRDGLVVLGSGSIPLASGDDLQRLIAVASGEQAAALTNNRYSSDAVAIGDASILASVPDLPADNALPRWLDARGVAVEELPDHARLAFDIDSPLDIELLRRHPACPPALGSLTASMSHHFERVAVTLDALARLAADPRAELLVTGRISSNTLHRLESSTACRVRAFVEERGLRASADIGDGGPPQRPPASGLGLLLDRDGPDEIGTLVGRLADGAIIDSRVLLAHRLGAGEEAWPSAEDRFASDLLLPERIRDPWLQQLTAHAWSHPVPIALGGHSLVGPGLPLALGLDVMARATGPEKTWT